MLRGRGATIGRAPFFYSTLATLGHHVKIFCMTALILTFINIGFAFTGIMIYVLFGLGEPGAPFLIAIPIIYIALIILSVFHSEIFREHLVLANTLPWVLFVVVLSILLSLQN